MNIAIIGKIGSGKSYICDLLSKKYNSPNNFIQHLSLDNIVKLAYLYNNDLINKVKIEFPNLVDNNGTNDFISVNKIKKELFNIDFDKLEKIIVDVIFTDTWLKYLQDSNDIYLTEFAPTHNNFLKFTKYFDYIIYVDCDYETRLSRVMYKRKSQTEQMFNFFNEIQLSYIDINNVVDKYIDTTSGFNLEEYKSYFDKIIKK